MPECVYYNTRECNLKMLVRIENKADTAYLLGKKIFVLKKTQDLAGSSMVKVVPFPSVEATVTSPP